MTARHRSGEDEGQATVEVALVLPLLLTLTLTVVQVVVLGRDLLLTNHAARAAAREAAVDRRVSEIERAARLASPALKADRLSTETSYRRGSPGMVTVTVSYRSQTATPLVGRLFPDVVVVANATFRDETDKAGAGTATDRSFGQDSRHKPWNPASVGQ